MAAGQKWGGVDGSAVHCVGSAAGHRPTPKILGSLKTIIVIILSGGRRVSRLSPMSCYALITCACSNKRSERLEGEERPDRPQTKRETPKPEEAKEGVGCESGT